MSDAAIPTSRVVPDSIKFNVYSTDGEDSGIHSPRLADQSAYAVYETMSQAEITTTVDHLSMFHCN